ncbi:beta strand repeat-containing protein [Leifsonia sp. NPDC058230]|uniref:beta strand repeat-containing protein n=1 Tax=Leifsonia sp. NPDC058230 TaxID=3346391 RepID=UPI0036DD0CF8
MASRAARAVAVVLSAALAVTGLIALAEPAQAAPAIVVDTNADADASGACAGSGTTLSTPVTLREALCVASNRGGAQTVLLPSDTYTLSAALGALTIGANGNANVTVQGTSRASTVIEGDGLHQVFTLDPTLLGGVSVTIDSVTVSGGAGLDFGGGGLIGGDPSGSDSLVVQNSSFEGNTSGASGATNLPGGAIQFVGGSLTVENTQFTDNSSGSSQGGAIYYQSVAGVSGQKLAVSGSTFTSNTTQSAGGVDNGGGAIFIADPAAASGTALTIDSSVFTGNAASGTAGQPARGGAIWVQTGALTVTASTFTANSVSGGGSGASAIDVGSATLNASGNRIAGNTGGPALVVGAGGLANAAHNWWGCASGPGATGCDTVALAGASTVTPFLTLTGTATPSLILPPATSSAIAVSMLTDSAGGAVDPASLGAFEGLPITWSATPAGAFVADVDSLHNGTAGATFFANSATGAGSARAALGATPIIIPVGIGALPAFTSTAVATAVVGIAGAFTVTTSGYPSATLSIGPGALPAGLAFTDNGDGTATIAGTPAGGTAGDYAFTLTAVNAVNAVSTAAPASVTQALVLHVQQAAALTSAAAATFPVGTASTFTVTTTGTPTPGPITTTGTLPSGVTVVDNGDGTATIAGTPAAGSGGVYSFTIHAPNGVSPEGLQSFTLTVPESPVFTSAATATLRLGTAASIGIAATAGFPAATTITQTGTLPAGLAFHSSGGSATIDGTPTATGVFTIGLTASNGGAPDAVQTLVITVRSAPVVTIPAADQTANAGNPVSFTATATGFPTPTVQWAVSTDGSNFADIAGATSPTYSFTAAQSQNGSTFRATFTNAAGVAATAADLTVGTAPTISSDSAHTFVGSGGTQTFTVTTQGVPDAVLGMTGAPSWLSLSDNHDGTGTLFGTPPAGSGGPHPFTITAGNGFSPDASQSFVLTVVEPPVFSSADAATFTVGSAGSFTVTTAAGFPAATTITRAGALPAGVTFTDVGGTATITGTPAARSGGVYSLTLTADNGGTPPASQTFTLTVLEPATFVSPASRTVLRGENLDFTVQTGGAYPAVTSITMSGALPTGIAFTDNGDGTATIAGTTADAAATFPLTFTASAPGQPPVQQLFDLVLVNAPVVNLPPIVPAGSGPVGGVPNSPKAGDTFTVTAGGFAAGAPVTFGIYSAPVVLALVNADALGTATATITIPAGYAGAHSIIAAGKAPDGTDRFLRTNFVLPGAAGGASTPAASGASGSPGNGLAKTGLDVSGLALLALLLLAAGAAIAARRIPRRR